MSANTVDPLKLIRVAYSVRETDRNPFNYCTSSGEVLESLSLECTHITIPSGQPSCPFLIFPRAVLTNYRSKRGLGPHYPLDTICFLLERKDDSYTNYLQDARKLGMVVVSLPDKKELVEYLMNSDTSATEYAAVDSEAELPVPLMVFPDSLKERESGTLTVLSDAEADEIEQSETETEQQKQRENTETQTAKKPTLDTSLIRPVQSTEALLHCDKDFSQIYNQTFKNYLATHLNASTGSKDKTVNRTSSSLLDQISSMNANNTSSSNSSNHSSKKTVWIIIVPAGSNSLLTLHNIKDFLSDSKYIPVSEARSRGPKPSSLRIEHSGNTFEIIDNPARLALNDWSRVLACFTLSSTWQFKGWKWETPLELFQHIVGFHVYFDDVALDQNVAGWNVTKLAISRNKRHLDATAVMTFWTKINDAIKIRTSRK